MAGIFISYRRSDAQGWAGHLDATLKGLLGPEHILRDLALVPIGVDFEDYLGEAVSRCDVLLALIGPQWLTASDRDGRRRLDDPKDLVRVEIGAALSRKIRVIPVLLGGAAMPSVDELPEELKPLARRQAHEVTDTRWDEDCRRLAQALKPLVPGLRGRQVRLILGIALAVVLLGGGVLALQWRPASERTAAREDAAKATTPRQTTTQPAEPERVGIATSTPKPQPLPAEPTAPKTRATVDATPPAVSSLESPATLGDRVLKARAAFYFGGRRGLLRVSDAEISCVSGRCEFGFTAATCAKEYIPTQDNGPIVSIVLLDRGGNELTQIIRTTAAWVKDKYDNNRIAHRLDDSWVSAAAWNRTYSLTIKGWQERARGTCS